MKESNRQTETMEIHATDRQIRFDRALLACIQTLHTTDDVDAAITELLRIIADFYEADRAYIFEFNLEMTTMNITYEWCRDSVEPQIKAMQNLDIAIIDRWMGYFKERGEFYINSLEELPEDSREYQILSSQNIESLMAAPLQLGDHMVGFFGVCNPRANTETLHLLQAVAAIVVNDLQKRMTVEQKMIGAIANIYLSMHLLNLVEDTQKEFQTNALIKRFVNEPEHASRQMKWAVAALTEKDFVNEMMEFTKLETLAERLTDVDSISHEFRSVDDHWCRANFITVSRDAAGKVIQVIFAIQYIDKQKRRELEYQRALKTALENQNEMYTELLKMQSGGVVVIPADEDTDEILVINDAALKLYGFGKQNPFDGKLSSLQKRISEEDREKVARCFQEALNTGKSVPCQYVAEYDDKRVYILSHIKMAVLANGDKVCISSLTDITEKAKMEQELLMMSRTDALTQINNRGSGEMQVESLLQSHTPGMFCVLDVDNFKSINDTLGHVAGDNALVAIADCMKSSFRRDDVIMRLGGDEFAVYVAGIKNEESGAEVIRRFFNKIENIDVLMLGKGKVSVSLGAVMHREDQEADFDALYQMADSAMYSCKHKRGNYYGFYRP